VASGSGAVGRQILGTVVVAGMLAATLLAVFVIPVLFVLFERIGLKFQEATPGHIDLTSLPAPHDAAERGDD
jgi:predicted RND superfamily exporter protein